MIGSAARVRMFGEVIRKFREVRIFLLHEGIYFYEEISWGVALRRVCELRAEDPRDMVCF